LERTLTDDTFRAQLFAEPDEALAAYSLDPSEAAALKALCIEGEASGSEALEQRQNKSHVPLWLLGL
jgi:hypothetical protein